MRAPLFLALLLSVIPAGVVLVGPVRTVSESLRSGRQIPPGPPVVLELFTSQGCSSCPPADALLRELETSNRDDGTVIPLAYHVDYWNRLGWRDPFSDARWTARQRRYAARFNSRTIYTPQLVVNGRTHVVGSDGPALAEAVAKTRRASRGGSLAVHIEDLRRSTARVEGTVTLEASHNAHTGNLLVAVALFENGLETRVRAGENAGRVLRNDYVVRRLIELEAWYPGGKMQAKRTFTFALDSSWRREGLGIATFLQDEQTLAIHGAAVRRPPLGNAAAS